MRSLTHNYNGEVREREDRSQPDQAELLSFAYELRFRKRIVGSVL